MPFEREIRMNNPVITHIPGTLRSWQQEIIWERVLAEYFG
jgi:hypothetical protein